MQVFRCDQLIWYFVIVEKTKSNDRYGAVTTGIKLTVFAILNGERFFDSINATMIQ